MVEALSALKVPHDAFVSFLDSFEIENSLDAGPVAIHQGSHPICGRCIAISSAESESVLMVAPDRQVAVETLLDLHESKLYPTSGR